MVDITTVYDVIIIRFLFSFSSSTIKYTCYTVLELSMTHFVDIYIYLLKSHNSYAVFELELYKQNCSIVQRVIAFAS